MLDNVNVVVLSKVNELAERYGLKPYHFVATFKHGAKGWTLDLECPASGNAVREERFDTMLQAIGITPGNDKGAILTGDTAKIINALDNALEHAPRPRRLF